MSLGKLVVELELDDNKFKVSVNNAKEVVRELSRSFGEADKSVKRIERSVTGLLPRFRDLSVGIYAMTGMFHQLKVGVYDWQMEIIKTNAEIERMTMLLRGMSDAPTTEGKMQQAADEVDYLIEMTQRAPYSLQGLTDAFVKMRSVGLDPTTGRLNALVDAVASFGGTEAQLHRASIAIQQMAGKGVISMEELRQQLGEAVPTAINMMARAMGMSYGDLVKQISLGRVEARTALDLMLGEFERSMGGSAQRMMQTWDGMTKQLSSQWMLFQKRIGDSGYFDEAKKGLQALIDSLKYGDLYGMADDIGRALGAMTNAIIEGVKFIFEYRTEIAALAMALGGLMVARMVSGFIRAIGTVAIEATRKVRDLTAAMRQLRNTEATQAAAASMGSLAGSIGKGVLAVGRFIPVIGGLVTAVWAGKEAWDMFANSQDKAIERMKEQTKDFTQSQLEQWDSGMEKLQDEIKANNEKIEELSTSTFKNVFWFEDTQKQIKELKATNEELLRTYEEFAEKRAQIAASAANKEAAKKAESYRRAKDASVSEIQQTYKEEMRIIQQAVENQTLTEEESRERRLRAARNYYTQLIEFEQNYLFALQTAAQNSSGDALALRLQEAADQALFVENLVGQMGERLNDIKEGGKLIEPSSNNTTNQVDKLKRYLDRTAGSTADMKAELAGMNGELAKFDYMLQSGQFGEAGEKLLGDPKKLEEARKAIAENTRWAERLRDARRAHNELKNISEELTTQQAELQQALADTAQEIQLGFDPSSSGVRGIQEMLAKLEAVEAILPEDKKRVEELREALQGLLETQHQLDAANLTLDYKNKTKDIRIGLMQERDAIRARYEEERRQVRAQMALIDTSTEQGKQAVAQMQDYLSALSEQNARNLETPMEKMLRDWDDTTSKMGQLGADLTQGLVDNFVDLAVDGKASFADLAESAVKSLIKIQLQAAITRAAADLEGGGGGGWMGAVAGFAKSFFKFANGGVMTDKGKLPTTAYATGGIADSPQLALFGEGSTPEAYVPLPDGKTIPVTMKGGGAGNVQVNVINQSGQPVDAQQGQPRFDGRQMILDVVLKAAGEPGSFRNGLKGALK